MAKISAGKLGHETRAMAEQLGALEPLPEHATERGFFKEERRSTLLGRKVIRLYQGTYGDDVGSESYYEQTTLRYNRSGKLRGISNRVAFEPSGPVVLVGGGLDVQDFVDGLMEKFKGEASRVAEENARNMIGRALLLHGEEI